MDEIKNFLNREEPKNVKSMKEVLKNVASGARLSECRH